LEKSLTAIDIEDDGGYDNDKVIKTLPALNSSLNILNDNGDEKIADHVVTTNKDSNVVISSKSPRIQIRSALDGFLLTGRLAKREEFAPKEIIEKVIKAEEAFVEDPEIVLKKKRRREMKDEAKRAAEEAEAAALRSRQLDAIERTGRPWGMPSMNVMPTSSSNLTTHISPSRTMLNGADTSAPLFDPYLIQQWPLALKKRTASFGIRPLAMRKTGRYILLWLASPKGLCIKKGGNAAVNLAVWMAIETKLPLVAIVTTQKNLKEDKVSSIEKFVVKSTQGKFLLEAKVPLLLLHSESNSSASDGLASLLLDLNLQSHSNREDESGKDVRNPLFAHCLIVDEPSSLSDLAVLEDLIFKSVSTPSNGGFAASSSASSVLSGEKLPPIWVSNGTCVVPTRQIRLEDNIQSGGAADLFSSLLSSVLNKRKACSEYILTLHPLLQDKDIDFRTFCIAILARCSPETPAIPQNHVFDQLQPLTNFHSFGSLDSLRLSTKSLAWDVCMTSLNNENMEIDEVSTTTCDNENKGENAAPSDTFNLLISSFTSLVLSAPDSDDTITLARQIISLLLQDWRSFSMYSAFSTARKNEIQRLRSSGTSSLPRPNPDGEWLHKLFRDIGLCESLHVMPPPCPSVTIHTPQRFDTILTHNSGDALFDAALKEWVHGHKRSSKERNRKSLDEKITGRVDMEVIEEHAMSEHENGSHEGAAVSVLTDKDIERTDEDVSVLSAAVRAMPRNLLASFIAARLTQWYYRVSKSLPASQSKDEDDFAIVPFKISFAALIGESGERALPRNELTRAEIVFDISRSVRGVRAHA
jgi:hypothetical protein